MTELKSWMFWRAVFAEFVGMLLFIYFGISAIIGNLGNSAWELKVSLAFALAIATLAQSLGHISGAHLNPAVTLGLLVSCQISILRCVFYILAQMLGAVAASAIVYGVRPSINSMGVNMLNKVTVGQGFVIEFLATLQLVLCVIAVTDKRRQDVTGSAPLAIGLSVGLGHFAAISFTGCGINPARSFGPALIDGNFKDHWVYWLGPMCGGIAAALIYDFLLYPRTHDFSVRKNVLLNGPEAENDLPELIREGNSSPGPSQWPKH
ncbi:aquaporin FA-CHIP-like [Centroberyx gerrardi]|uniref:aquaporin FA-CHIP-like n=1 Tax=Centroberyx gerrardi TaxID=166262 RepID=UPI003AAB916A